MDAIDELRRKRMLKYRTRWVILRVFQIIIILSIGCAVWIWRSLLFSSLILADSKINGLRQHLASLRF
jgi:hypothetical protein